MRKLNVIGIAALILAPLSSSLAEQPAPVRAMSADSAKPGASPNPKSERAMNPDAGKPGSAPNGKSERAMDPNKSDK